MLHLTVLAAAAAAKSDKLTGLTSLLAPISRPIAEILAGFYAVIPNFGVAILLLSIVWMILIAPLNLKATRSMLAMQKLQPLMKKIQDEHKNDRVASAQAMQELYKEHNVSPWGSCLPTLLPLPVFIALFYVIDGMSHISTVTGKAAPRFLSAHTQMYQAIVAAHGHLNAFGMDLSKNALSSHSSFAAAIPYFALLLIMMGSQYLQTAQMMRRNPQAQANPSMKFMKYLPFVIGIICIRFPAGVILYYATSAVFRIAQQTLMYRYDPKVRALVAQEVREVETLTKEIETSERGNRRASRPQQGAPKAAPPARGGSPTPEAPRSRFAQLLEQAQAQAANKAQNKAQGQAKAQPSSSKTNGSTPRATRSPTPPAPSPTPTRRSAPAGGPSANGAARAKPALPASKPPPTTGKPPSPNGGGSAPRRPAAAAQGSGSASSQPSHRTNRKRKRR